MRIGWASALKNAALNNCSSCAAIALVLWVMFIIIY